MITDNTHEAEGSFKTYTENEYQNRMDNDLADEGGKSYSFNFGDTDSKSAHNGGSTTKKEPLYNFTSTDLIRANRRVCSLVSDEEYRSLQAERAVLAKKSYKETLTKEEKKHLDLINWELEQIEDAKFGESLDQFERFVDQQEKFAVQISDFIHSVKAAKHNPRS